MNLLIQVDSHKNPNNVKFIISIFLIEKSRI